MLSDVEQIASYAMQTGYYANAIELSRDIFQMLPQYHLGFDEAYLQERMAELRSKLVKLKLSLSIALRLLPRSSITL